MMQTPYRVAWFACLIIGLVSLMHGGAAPAQSAQDETEFVLLTDAEAEQLRVTDADLLLPVSTPMTSDGPHIVLRRPDITGTGKTPTVTTTFQSFKFSSIEAEVFMMIFRSGQPSYEMLDSTSGHPHSLCLSRCHR